MPSTPSIIVYCVPQCGHARAVIELLRRRNLPFTQRLITSDAAAGEIISAYHLYGSPILVVNGEVITGTNAVLVRIETLAPRSRTPSPLDHSQRSGSGPA